MRDGPGDAGHDAGRAALAGRVEDLDADDVGGRRDAAELHVGVAALFERQRGGAVAGDESGDEGAVAGVVVRRLLLVDEVLPADDAAGAQVGVVATPLSITATPTPAPVGPPAAGEATLSRPMDRLVTSSELA